MLVVEDSFFDHAAEFVHRHALLDRLLAGVSDCLSHQTLEQTHLLLALNDSRKNGNRTRYS